MKSIRMTTIMDEIGSVLRQGHFEIENSKDRRLLVSKEKQKVSYKGSIIRLIICF